MGDINVSQQSYMTQDGFQREAAQEVFSISADKKEAEITDLFLVKKDQCGRLFFTMKNLSAINDFSAENSTITLSLSSDLGYSQEVGSYKLRSDRFVQDYEADFCAGYDYHKIIISKSEQNRDASFEISNFSFFPLAMSKNNFNNLFQTIFGNSDYTKMVYDCNFNSKIATHSLKFMRSNQFIGQTFTASSDTISGVDLKMRFLGIGGQGNYSAELRETSYLNNKVQLSENRIAVYYFNQNKADKDLAIGSEVYHIPLTGHLEIGKRYSVVINNKSVGFNILNTLYIFTRPEDKGNETAFVISPTKKSELVGNLYLKVYGMSDPLNTATKFLSGSKIFDNGDGTGSYVYTQKGDFSDFLDLDRVITASNKKYNVFYDNLYGGVSAKAEEDNAFVYKVNTVYPFTKMRLTADGQSGMFFTTSAIYYSFDNVLWKEIRTNPSENGDMSGEFDKLIDGNGEVRVVYIKTTYDKDLINNQSGLYFGLKNLKVTANLTIK